jgi:hypothetical protein
MPIIPEGSPLTITASSPSSITANLAVNAIVRRSITPRFKRSEFSHERLLGAKNVDGSRPSIYYLSGNNPIQFFTNCNENETERPLTPDDDDLDLIYRRFNTRRYEITGAMSLASEVKKLSDIHQLHSVFLANFEDHLEKAANADISYEKLVEMQGEDFSYLTSTGVTMTGTALATYSGESNLLLVEFSPSVEQDNPTNTAGTTSEVLEAWTMVLERRVIVAASAATWS